MRIFYCPECGSEEIKGEYPNRDKTTLANIRDGYGRPITHYKCDCGNYLAGSMDISGWEDDPGSIQYCKEVIKEYNRGGIYYTEGMYEKASENFRKRNSR